MKNLKKIGLTIAMLFGAQHAISSPIVFTFDSLVTSANLNPYGVSAGDSSTLSLTLDNGGTGFLGQSWSVGDIISAMWVSGSYSALWSDSTTSWYSSASPQFATDALGTVITANFQGSSTSTGTDNGGTSAYLYSNGVGTSGSATFIMNSYYGVAADVWQASEAEVPVPATLALFGLGLAGLGWSRRKKA